MRVLNLASVAPHPILEVCSMRRPSPGTIIAIIALFVALGGPAQASRLITGKQVKSATLTGKHIKNRSLGAGELSAAANRRFTEVKAGSVGAGSLADGAVTAGRIGLGAVGSAAIGDGSVGAGDLAPDSVGAEELAANAVESADVQDGVLTARDVASFVGTLPLDFPAVNKGFCQFLDRPVAAVANTSPAKSISDDAIIVATPPEFPDDKLVVSAAPAGATTLRVRICNLNGTDGLDLPQMTFRYISFDF
jgi:hypothetical protein